MKLEMASASEILIGRIPDIFSTVVRGWL